MNRSLGIAIAAAAVVVSLAVTPAAQTPETVTFTATLSPANEVPPVTNAESTGSGDVTITMKLTRDAAKAITAATVDITANLKGFPAGTAFTAAHIHTGATGVNGPPAVNAGLKAGEVTLTNGSGSFTKAGVTVTPATAESILTTPAGFYFNVHSTMNGGGVVRGQLARKM